MLQSLPDKVGALPTRIIMGLVLAPPVLAVIYFGRPFIDILVVGSAAVMGWELAKLTMPRRALDLRAVLTIVVLLPVLGASVFDHETGLWILLAGVPAVVLISRERRAALMWQALGSAYIVLACIGFLWIRALPEGLAIVLWLLILVWATDIAAYAAGRLVGGPKLLPAISPNKTWAGLLGGIVAAACVGLVFAALIEAWPTGYMTALSAGLAVVAQSGDLLESRLKRRFGAKDAGHLIPGHGGLLDRVDGLLSTTLVLTLILLSARVGT